ncbi:MAG: outer membrane lipoprotein carrier protein LolA [Bacteroidaceae bacterium]|nr:outer membrane lipoprotein carrier protein LolA [Bacteroidaceae bacterium]MBP5630475.1 outer membrane lipoprotein carrier protein LolA [Bacteroidaceae bacterium]
MKRYLLSIVCCLLSVVLNAQGLSEQKIIQKMTASAEAIQTVKCNFTQKKQSKMLKGEQVSEGKMFCQQPDKLRWEYTSPKPSTLVLDGTKAQLLKGGEQGTRNKFVGEMARMIMNSVAGKCLTDSKTFLVSAKEMPTKYVATLVPQKKDMKRLYAKLVLHYDIKQETVTEIELYEKNGDRTLIELHDISINGK